MKKTICFILFTALIIFVSCGIPSIYVPTSSDINWSRNRDTGTFTIKLSSAVLEEMSSSYPDIYFFYTISSENTQRSAFFELISSFNKTYCAETSGSIDFSSVDSEAVTTYKSGDSTYGIYKLNNLKAVNISGESSVSFTLALDSSTGYLTLTDNNSGTVITGIGRINNNKFDKSFSGDITDYSAGSNYTVKVYAVVSCQFDLYSNIYNTTINQDNPILQFSLND